jgi:hypothetical protein
MRKKCKTKICYVQDANRMSNNMQNDMHQYAFSVFSHHTGHGIEPIQKTRKANLYQLQLGLDITSNERSMQRQMKVIRGSW